MSNDAEFFPGLSKSWALTFMVNDEEAPTGRPAGALGWAGLANLFYWIDRKNGFGGFWATQILPFVDPVSFGGYIDFETAFYDSLRRSIQPDVSKDQARLVEQRTDPVRPAVDLSFGAPRVAALRAASRGAGRRGHEKCCSARARLMFPAATSQRAVVARRLVAPGRRTERHARSGGSCTMAAPRRAFAPNSAPARCARFAAAGGADRAGDTAQKPSLSPWRRAPPSFSDARL